MSGTSALSAPAAAREAAGSAGASAGSALPARAPESTSQVPAATLLEWARRLYTQREFGAAAALCMQARQEASAAKEAAYCLALVAERQGEPAQALARWLEVLREAPADAAALRSVLRLAQDSPEVFQAWERQAAWRQPKDALPLLLTLSRSALPEAASRLAEAQKLAQDSGEFRTLLLVAMQHESDGRLDQARSGYRSLLTLLGGQRSSLAGAVRERLARLERVPTAPADPAEATVADAKDSRRDPAKAQERPAATAAPAASAAASAAVSPALPGLATQSAAARGPAPSFGDPR